MGMAESMRRDWDQRARKDAFYYIASWRKDWDLPGFLQSGDEDYARLGTSRAGTLQILGRRRDNAGARL